ncbi:hypothetical protein ACFU1R_24950 [Priestia megaterium]|uniref:hypothetical protein n=1 Tax=Priestia megaterium TaxID=1404 RepID=UPI0036719C29
MRRLVEFFQIIMMLTAYLCCIHLYLRHEMSVPGFFLVAGLIISVLLIFIDNFLEKE